VSSTYINVFHTIMS